MRKANDKVVIFYNNPHLLHSSKKNLLPQQCQQLSVNKKSALRLTYQLHAFLASYTARKSHFNKCLLLLLRFFFCFLLRVCKLRGKKFSICVYVCFTESESEEVNGVDGIGRVLLLLLANRQNERKA